MPCKVGEGAERRDLQHEQNQASHDIYRQKHDGQDRPPAAVRDLQARLAAEDRHQREDVVLELELAVLAEIVGRELPSGVLRAGPALRASSVRAA